MIASGPGSGAFVSKSPECAIGPVAVTRLCASEQGLGAVPRAAADPVP